MIRFSVTLAAIVFAASAAHAAQSYPAKPVRFIIPFPPGGSADFFARMLVPDLVDALGQQVVVDNRGGASGTIGTELGARAAADGHTIVLITSNATVNVSLYPHWGINPGRDFRPVSLLGSAPNIVAVSPSLPVKNMSELIALAKSKPGQLRYASGGSGSTPHLAAELLKTMAHVDLLHVPYKGTGPALVGVFSGEAAVVVPPASVGLPHAKSGKLRALAICSATRFDAASDLPTVAESGVPGYEASQWYGVMVPLGTPTPIVARLNRDLVKIVTNPDFKARMLAQATMVSGTTPEALAAHVKSETAKWAKVIQLAKVRLE